MIFDEYKKLLSWNELKRLNSFEELKGLSVSEQIYYSGFSTLRAFGHWQVWIAMAFLALLVYLGKIIGAALELRIGTLNIGILSGAIVGGAVYSIVATYEMKKTLRKLLRKKRLKA